MMRISPGKKYFFAPQAKQARQAVRLRASKRTAFETPHASDSKPVFKLLFEVVFLHDYYNDNSNLCPDLRLRPTPACAKSMSALGLIFRDTGSGFRVYYNESGIDNLLASIRRAAKTIPGGETEYWSRLSFVAISENPNFVGMTDIPLTLSPGLQNFYLSNCKAHVDGDRTLLMPGAYVKASALYSVIPSQASFWSQDGGVLEVADIAGNRFTIPPEDEIGTKTKYSPGSETVFNVDLSSLPLGLYSFHIKGSPNLPETRLYTGGVPRPLCFFDMMLTRPKSSEAGIYPVTDFFSETEDANPEVISVVYTLRFRARQTVWRYFFVSQNAKGSLSGLTIEGDGTRIDWGEGVSVTLPTGAEALQFTASKTLPLRRDAEHRFRLNGKRTEADGRENDIRIAALPSAPETPVWPDTREVHEPYSGISEMFVYV